MSIFGRSGLFCLFLLSAFCARAQTGNAGGQEIKEQISHATIIGLGEQGHGYTTINEAKADLTVFLKQELGLRVLLFESSFTESVIAYLEKDTLATRTTGFLYPFWNTTSVKKCIGSFTGNEDQLSKPLVLGFDVQEDCRFTRFSKYLSEKGIITANRGKLLACDSILNLYIGKVPVRKTLMHMREYALLMEHYVAITSELKSQNLDVREKKLLERCLANRKALCKYLTLKTRDRMKFRDNFMAENISWLIEEMYKQDKIILWSANTHIGKKVGLKWFVGVGEAMAGIYRGKYFAVSFEKGTKGKPFILGQKHLKYVLGTGKPFDMTIYLDHLEEIPGNQWITPCSE